MKHMVLVTLSLALTALSLTGCDDGNTTIGETNTHTHAYAATWSKDAVQHWRECTANDGAKSEVANHSGDPCTVCDYYSGANPAKTIFSITAAYASTNPVFPDTPLDTLKAGLTVTARYMDNNSATLDAADYTLSGTLTTGYSVVTVTCEGKTATFTVTVYPLHEHQWSKIGEAPPTCTAPGRDFWRCSASPQHNETRDGGAAALGHDEGAWYTTIPATCTETGTRELRCTRDAVVLTPTETTTIAIDPDAHDYGNWTETTAPTCTTAGEDTRTCAHDVTHTDTRPKDIDPTAHNWNGYITTTPATCTLAGIETDTCSIEDSHIRTRTIAIDPNAHDYQWVTSAPSLIEEGMDKEICSYNATHTGSIRNVTSTLITTTQEWNDALSQLNGKTGNSYTLTIGGSFTVAGNYNSSTITFTDTFGTTADGSVLGITLKGSGKLYLNSRGNMLRLSARQTLIIDSENLTLEGLKNGQNGATQDNNAPLVYVAVGASLELRDGTISGNAATASSSNGGGVYNYGTFTMNNGAISGNTASATGGYSSSSNGGGVYNYGTFTMNNGAIYGNIVSTNGTSSDASARGGGVYSHGTFTMNNGTISGNTATATSGVSSAEGGGVYNDATFTMNNGTIYGNTTDFYGNASNSSNGGGVYNYVTFTMNNGTISGNTAISYNNNYASNGGGVYNYGAFTMNNGTISGNTAVSYNTNYASRGGGVYVSGIFRIVNGTVYGSNETDASLRNTASGNSAALSGSTVQRGTFSGTNGAWVSKGTLTAAPYYVIDNTIKVANGEIVE